MYPDEPTAFRRFWTGERIDRTFAVNSQRLLAGLHVSPGWRQAVGSLVVAAGRGKFLRLIHASDERELLDDSAVERLVGAQQEFQLRGLFPADAGQLLAEQLAPLAGRLAAAAGRYVDRILAIALDEPGFWRRDFDGLAIRAPVCDCQRLAELGGISVLDDFPGRDLAAGGAGRPLDALPLWFLFADRAERAATGDTLLLFAGEESRWVLLPASDGLDEIVPEIRQGALDWEMRGPENVRKPALSPAARELLAALFQPQTGDSLLQRIVLVPEPSSQTGLVSLQNAVESLLAQCPPRVQESIRTEVADADSHQLAARCAAILGLLYADQMPQNVPSLTGAGGLRLLGRLTPGKPFSFRHLVATMADGQTTPMRLRDAVQERREIA